MDETKTSAFPGRHGGYQADKLSNPRSVMQTTVVNYRSDWNREKANPVNNSNNLWVLPG